MPFTNYFETEPEETEDFQSAKRRLQDEIFEFFRSLRFRPTRSRSFVSFGPQDLEGYFASYALEIFQRMSRRMEARRRKREEKDKERCPGQPWLYSRYVNAEWLWEKFIPSLCEAISAPDGLWLRILAPILYDIDIHNEVLGYDCSTELYHTLAAFAYLELKAAHDADQQDLLRAYGVLLYPNRHHTSVGPETASPNAPSDLPIDSETAKDDTKLGPAKARKGDAALLGNNRLVSFRTAEQYLGIRERQRERLISSGALRVEGQGQNRKVTVESLKAYLPSEIPT